MKKFNKFIIIRVLCVFVAIISLGVSVCSVYWFSNDYRKVSEIAKHDYLNAFFERKGINLPASREFSNRYLAYLENLYTFIPTGDGTVSDFKKYCSDYEKNLHRASSAVAQNLGISSSDGTIKAEKMFFIFQTNGAKLSFLGKHEHGLHVVDGSKKTECYRISQDEDTVSYLAKNGVVYDSYGQPIMLGEIEKSNDNYILSSYDFSDDDETLESTTAASIVSSEVVVSGANPAETYSEVRIETNYRKIPNSIKEKANNQTIIRLCNVLCEGKIYDGFYSVEFSDNFISNHYDTERFFAGTKYSNFNDFKSDHSRCEEFIRNNPDFLYLVTDKLGNKVSGNVESISKIRDCNWYAVRTTTDGIVETSEAYTNFVYSFEDNKCFLKSDENYTIAIAYDSSFDGNSPLAEFKNGYSGFRQDFEHTIKNVCVSILILVLSLVVLGIFSGRKSFESGIHLHKADKIPTFLRIIFDWALILSSAYAVAAFDSHNFSTAFPLFPSALTYFEIVFVVLILCDIASFSARHIKNKSFFKNTIIGKIVFEIKKIKRAKKEFNEDYLNVFRFFKRRIVAFFVGISILVLSAIFVAASFDFWILSLLIIAFALIILGCACFFVLKYVSEVKTILLATEKIKNGDYEVSLNVLKYMKPLQPYARHINEITLGFKNAIDRAIIEQNTKTELITNITHDLKTPLTSIINYVDLLGERNIEDEKATRYIEILNEKSSRLKRLIEDLVEASKATTGNVDVELVEMSLTELVKRITGEYEDEMAASGLELVSTIPDKEIKIIADSRMICRVFDNLMNNARKYSMKGTRIYASIEENEKTVSFVLKNISSAPLNISAKELKQRFVRGDISRTTDGSGLGLSIAENFCVLMDAKLDLSISGDMFEAKVIFNKQNA